MSEADLNALRETLGAGAESVLSHLDAADAGRLNGLIVAAQNQQREQVAEASEQSLQHVPAVLRRAVRKLLFS